MAERYLGTGGGAARAAARFQAALQASTRRCGPIPDTLETRQNGRRAQLKAAKQIDRHQWRKTLGRKVVA